MRIELSIRPREGEFVRSQENNFSIARAHKHCPKYAILSAAVRPKLYCI